MKQRGLLFVIMLLLTGCFNQNADNQMYASDNLRAPIYQPYNNNMVGQSGLNMPQSVTQPMNINPIPSQSNMQSSVSQPQATQPQQPLVQTIVIPQYTPQPTVLPYVPTQYNSQAQTTQPFNNAQQITIPAQNIVAPNTPVVQPQATPVVETPARISQVEMQPSPQSVAQNKATERVYPSWAATHFSDSDVGMENAVLSFKNPNRNETVQCAAVDVMCIASYQQQGYKQIQNDSIIKPVPAQIKRNTSGYPDTDWDDNAIPRW